MSAECRQLLSTAFEQDHPVAVRYPRGSGARCPHLRKACPSGKEIRRERVATDDLAAPRVAILAFGTLLYPALQAAESLERHRCQHALGQNRSTWICCCRSLRSTMHW